MPEPSQSGATLEGSFRRGALFSTAAAMLGAVFLIVFKAAGLTASAQTIVLATLAWAALFNTIVAIRSKRRSWFDRTTLIVAGGLALFTLVGNLSVSKALVTLQPALTSVVTHTQVFLVAIVAHFLLRERITRTFALGAIISVGGLAVMRLWGESMQVAGSGVLWALLASVSWAMMQVIPRSAITRIELAQVNALRLWLAVAALSLVPGSVSGVLNADSATIALTAAAAFVGPFLSRLCLLHSLRHINASHSTLITLSGPLFAAGLAFIVFRDLPSGGEVAGAVLILAGIALPARALARASS